MPNRPHNFMKVKHNTTQFTKNQIVAVLLLNIVMFFGSLAVVIKSVNVSNLKTVASLIASLGFLFLIIAVLIRNWRTLFKPAK